MAEDILASVGRVDVQGAAQTVQQAQSLSNGRQAVAPKPKEVVAAKPRPAAEAEKKDEPVEPLRVENLQIGKETNLKFQVDTEKHTVTIMIVDRATDKIIATIPPEAIKDIPPGELLNYPA
jgi:uncharacterized FlaG/YvyC family protein